MGWLYLRLLVNGFYLIWCWGTDNEYSRFYVGLCVMMHEVLPRLSRFSALSSLGRAHPAWVSNELNDEVYVVNRSNYFCSRWLGFLFSLACFIMKRLFLF